MSFSYQHFNRCANIVSTFWMVSIHMVQKNFFKLKVYNEKPHSHPCLPTPPCNHFYSYVVYSSRILSSNTNAYPWFSCSFTQKAPRWVHCSEPFLIFHLKNILALADMAQFVGCRPANWTVTGLIPHQGTCPGCGLRHVLGWGTCLSWRQTDDVSLSHQWFSPSLFSPSPSLESGREKEKHFGELSHSLLQPHSIVQMY